MKYFSYFLLCAFFLNGYVHAQNIAINATGAVPSASAMLDIESTNSGLLVPRMTLAQRNAIANPATSLLIFQTNSTPGFYYNAGTPGVPDWVRLFEGEGWSTTGNGGTVANSNFLGTTDNIALRFRTNNLERFEISTGTGATGGHLRAFNNGSAAAPTYSFTASTGVGLWRPTNNVLAFSTSSAEAMRITPAGQVLVSTLNPTDPNRFEVRVTTGNHWGVNSYNTTFGAGAGGAGFFTNTSGSNGFNALEATTAGSNAGVWGWNTAAGTGVRGTVSNVIVGWAGFFQGDVGTTGAYFGSDERWKKEIRNLGENSILDKIMQLQPKRYQWKADEFPGMGFDPTRTSFGFIGQEIMEIFPELVKTEKAIPDPTKEPEARQEADMVTGYYMVDYIGLVPVLTQAVQEQQAIIQSQETQINAQEAVLQELLQRVTQLENQLSE